MDRVGLAGIFSVPHSHQELMMPNPLKGKSEVKRRDTGAKSTLVATPGSCVGRHDDQLLRFHTPCGTGLMTHPSVVFIPQEFSGYPYWMAGTPYDGVDDSIENPCIFASHDGTNWEIPPGATNPVAPTPPGKAHNSDAHLAFDGTALHLWYRRTNDGYDTILHAISSDGTQWSTFDYALRLPQHRERILSPTICRSSTRWFMYTVKFIRQGNHKIVQRREADDPSGPWGPPTSCDITLPDGRLPWHIDVCHVGSEYWMVIADSISNKGGDLFFATSKDGLSFDVAQEPLLSRHSAVGSGLYRSALVARPAIDKAGHESVIADAWYSVVDGRRWGVCRGEIILRRPLTI